MIAHSPRFVVTADSPQAALVKAKAQVDDEHAEECDNEWFPLSDRAWLRGMNPAIEARWKNSLATLTRIPESSTEKNRAFQERRRVLWSRPWLPRLFGAVLTTRA